MIVIIILNVRKIIDSNSNWVYWENSFFYECSAIGDKVAGMFTPRACVFDCDCDCESEDNKWFKFKLSLEREFIIYEWSDIDDKACGMSTPHTCVCVYVCVYDFDFDCDCKDNK